MPPAAANNGNGIGAGASFSHCFPYNFFDPQRPAASHWPDEYKVLEPTIGKN